MSADAMIATETSPCRRPGSGALLWNSTSEMRAAAPPPTPLNSATICGIAVIFTLRAPTTPITAPIAIPTAMNHHPVTTSSFVSVTTTATSIPNAPIHVPSRAWRGDERNRSARMNDAIVIRYSRFDVFSDTLELGLLVARRAPLEHLEHSIGDDEAADHVRGRQDHGDERD